MTDTIDAALGATTGLLAIGIMAGVASKMMGKNRMMGNGKYPKAKRTKLHLKQSKLKW